MCLRLLGWEHFLNKQHVEITVIPGLLVHGLGWGVILFVLIPKLNTEAAYEILCKMLFPRCVFVFLKFDLINFLVLWCQTCVSCVKTGLHVLKLD